MICELYLNLSLIVSLFFSAVYQEFLCPVIVAVFLVVVLVVCFVERPAQNAEIWSVQCVAELGCSFVACFRPLYQVSTDAGRSWRFLQSAPGFSSYDQFLSFVESSQTNNQIAARRIPCGRCVGCRLQHSCQWAARCVHELRVRSSVGTFATLTYDDEHLPLDLSLDRSEVTLFIKRLRYYLRDLSISFFGCGEYGGRFGRPHYHICLFGFDDLDKEPISSSGPNQIYYSPLLSYIWRNGNVILGELNFDTAAYVARYTLKKTIDNKHGSDYYTIPHPSVDGVVIDREPEFVCCSLRPAIGYRWIRRNYPDVYQVHDAVIIGKKTIRPPRYYDKCLSDIDPLMYNRIKDRRITAACPESSEFTVERLAVREESRILKSDFFRRVVDRSSI